MALISVNISLLPGHVPKHERGSPDSTTDITFRNYCQDYIETRKQLGYLKESTYLRYKDLAKRAYQSFGDVLLRDLSVSHLDDFYRILTLPGANKRTNESLSPVTIMDYHRLISLVLKDAEAKGYIPANIADKATIPKQHKPTANYYQPEDVKQILAAANLEPIRRKALIYTFLLTGARRGEVLALHWEDIDFSNEVIHIRKNLMCDSTNGIYLTTPKNESSVRDIPLCAELTAVLQELKESTPSRGFVFTTKNDKPLNPSGISHFMHDFGERYNLPPINPHAFRHTFASLLITEGVDITTVSKLLGHAQISTTQNVYAHVIESKRKQSGSVISKIYFNNIDFT